MTGWIKPCEQSPLVGQKIWMAYYDNESVIAGVYTGKHGTGYYGEDGVPKNPKYWMNRTPPPRHPETPLTIRDALTEAIEALEAMGPHYGVNVLMFRGREIIPRLRAALEAE